jgi:WD40 repeat protein
MSGKPVRPPGNGDPIRAAAFIPGTNWFASANAFGRITVIDLLKPNESPHSLTGHDDGVTCLTATPDGTLLVSGGDDKAIRGWNPARDELKWTLSNLPARVTVLAVSPDGKRLAAGFADRSWRVWELP